jgi:hypothetical protein
LVLSLNPKRRGESGRKWKVRKGRRFLFLSFSFSSASQVLRREEMRKKKRLTKPSLTRVIPYHAEHKSGSWITDEGS